jgi:peptidoglycan hydrolase-like protein with peptidoglycan-binding domain
MASSKKKSEAENGGLINMSKGSLNYPKQSLKEGGPKDPPKGRNKKNPSTLDLYNYNNFLNEEGTTDPAETGVKKATTKKKPTAFDLYNSKVENKKDVVEEELRTSGPFRQFDVDNLEASSEENKIEPIEKTSEIYSKKSQELMKLKEDSKEIEKGAEGKYVGEYQRILKDQGLYTDEIDDKFGPNTRQAVKDYQEEKGMEVTGVIDANTAAELIAEKEVEPKIEMEGNVDYVLGEISKLGYLEEGEEMTKEKFENIKKEINSDIQNSYLPALAKPARSMVGINTGNMTEENYSEKELELMKKIAVRGGKLNKTFAYDDAREGTDLEGKAVSEYASNLMTSSGAKESVTLSLSLGAASIIKAPDGYVYVFDTFDYNDSDKYGIEDKDGVVDKRTPDEVFSDWMQGARDRGETGSRGEIAYAVARGQGSRNQRRAQIEASEKGEVWKPSVALIKLGKAEDLLKEYGDGYKEATKIEKDKKEVQKEKKEVEKKQSKSIPENVGKGARGSYVEDYQEILKYEGHYKDTLDGKFGKNTKQAVMDFQREKGIKEDGIIGKDTKRELEKARKKKG